MVYVFDPKLPEYFSNLFLNSFHIPASDYLTIVIFISYLYIIKKFGFEKALQISLPIFLFGALIIYQFFSAVSSASILIVLFIINAVLLINKKRRGG